MRVGVVVVRVLVGVLKLILGIVPVRGGVGVRVTLGV